MHAEPRSVRVEGPADLELVDTILDRLDSLWPDAPRATDEDRMLFTLAVSEIATNIVQHAGGQGTTTVSAVITVLPDAVHAEFRDDAVPAAIEWHTIAMPEPESESGRGLALAQAALDEFTHRYDGHSNVWTLRRDLTSRP